MAKTGGSVFGILKGALLLSILIFIVNYFNFGNYLFKEEAQANSIFYESIESIAPKLYSWLDSNNFTFEIPDKEELLDKVY